MKLQILYLFLSITQILCFDANDYIPKDEGGLGYFISYKNGTRNDLKVEDVISEFEKIKKNLK
jgi:hypothetical protein